MGGEERNTGMIASGFRGVDFKSVSERLRTDSEVYFFMKGFDAVACDEKMALSVGYRALALVNTDPEWLPFNGTQCALCGETVQNTYYDKNKCSPYYDLLLCRGCVERVGK